MCSAASATVRLTGEELRPGLAKVGRGARGARGAGGHGQRRGPHPAWRGQIPLSIIRGGQILVEAGGSATRSPRGRTGPGRAPPDRYRGGGRGSAPGLLVAEGRRGGDQTGLWARNGEGGRRTAGRARGQTPRGPRGLGEGSRGRPFLEGGGVAPCPGDDGNPS